MKKKIKFEKIIIALGIFIAILFCAKGIAVALGEPMKPYDWLAMAMWTILLVADFILLRNVIIAKRRNEKIEKMFNELEEVHNDLIKSLEDNYNAEQGRNIES